MVAPTGSLFTNVLNDFVKPLCICNTDSEIKFVPVFRCSEWNHQLRRLGSSNVDGKASVEHTLSSEFSCGPSGHPVDNDAIQQDLGTAAIGICLSLLYDATVSFWTICKDMLGQCAAQVFEG